MIKHEYRLTIDLDNDAFQQDMAGEMSRILRYLSEKALGEVYDPTILDSNGNTVGVAKICRLRQQSK